MRTALALIVGIALAVVGLGLVGTGTLPAQDLADRADGAFAWRTDLDAAREEARETGRPLLVVFR